MQLSPKLRSILDGDSDGPAAKLYRLLFWAPAGLYGTAVQVRNRLYDAQILKPARLEASVVCVGNITAGGTGKTPMVVWLSRYLRAQGHRVAVLCRGYKASDGKDNDETKMIRRSLPEIAVVVDPDRVRGGRVALWEHQADVVVLDDGYQHRRLHRDLDLVMLDAMNPFGDGLMQPAGLLREPKSELCRADAVIISRSDQVESRELQALRNRVEQLLNRGGGTHKPVALARHAAAGLCDPLNNRYEPQELRGRKVFVFCGIGNPKGFLATLQSLGAEIAGSRFLADHTAYSEGLVKGLIEAARRCRAEWLVTTEKDWVKLREISCCQSLKNFRWLEVNLEIFEGREALCKQIDNLFSGKGTICQGSE